MTDNREDTVSGDFSQHSITSKVDVSKEKVSPDPEGSNGFLEDGSRGGGAQRLDAGPSDTEGRSGLLAEAEGNERLSEKDLNSENENGCGVAVAGGGDSSNSNGGDAGTMNEDLQLETGPRFPQRIFENLILPTSARLNPTVGSYLEKLSPTALKGFQRRFFRLNLTDNALLYWREEPTFPDQQPTGSINLSSVIAIHIEDALNFVIRTFGRDYCLRALSPGDKDIWLESICMVVNAVAHRETLKDASNHYNFSKMLLDSSGSIQTYLTEALKTQRKVKWAKEDRVPLTFSLRGKRMFLGIKGIQNSLAKLWFDCVFDVKYLCQSPLSLEIPGGGQSAIPSGFGLLHTRQQVSMISSSAHPSPSSISVRGVAERGQTRGRHSYRTRSSSYCTSTSFVSQQSSPAGAPRQDEGHTQPTRPMGGVFARRSVSGNFYGTYRGQNLKISKNMIGADLSNVRRLKASKELAGLGSLHQASEGSRLTEPNIQSFTRMRSHLDNVLFGTIYVEIGPLPSLEHITQSVLASPAAPGHLASTDSSSSAGTSSSPLSTLQKFFALLISSRPIANNEAFFPLPNNLSLKPQDHSALSSRFGWQQTPGAFSSPSQSQGQGQGQSRGSAGSGWREMEGLPFNIQLDCLYLFSPEYDGSPPLYVIELDNIQLSSKIREVHTGFQFRLQVPLGNILASLRDPVIEQREPSHTTSSASEAEEVEVEAETEITTEYRETMVTTEKKKEEESETSRETVGSPPPDTPPQETDFDGFAHRDEREAVVTTAAAITVSGVLDVSGPEGESRIQTQGEVPGHPHSESEANTATPPSSMSNLMSVSQSVSPYRDTRYASVTQLLCDPSLILFGMGSRQGGTSMNNSCHEELLSSVSSVHSALQSQGIPLTGGSVSHLSSERVSIRVISIFGPDAEIWREALIASCRARHAAKENMQRTLHDELRAFDSIPKELLDENITQLFYKTLVYMSASFGPGTEDFGSFVYHGDYRRVLSPSAGLVRSYFHSLGLGMHSLGSSDQESGSFHWRNAIVRMVSQISSSFVTIPVWRILQGLDVFNSTGRDLLQASIRTMSNPRVDILRFVHDRYLVPILMVIQECLERRGDLLREVDTLLIIEFLVDLRLSYESCGIYDSKFKYLILQFSSLYMGRLIQPYYRKIFKSIHNTCYLGKTFRDKESGTLHISLFSELFSNLYSIVNLFTGLRLYHYSVEVRNAVFMAVQRALLQYQLAIRDVLMHNLSSIAELSPDRQRFFFHDHQGKRREGGVSGGKPHDDHDVGGPQGPCPGPGPDHERRPADEMDYSKITVSSEVICGMLNGMEYCICKCDELDLLMERWSPFVLYRFEQEYFREFSLDNMILGNNISGGIGTRLTTAHSVEVLDSNINSGNASILMDQISNSNSNNSNTGTGMNNNSIGISGAASGGDLASISVGGGMFNSTNAVISSNGNTTTSNSGSLPLPSSVQSVSSSSLVSASVSTPAPVSASASASASNQSQNQALGSTLTTSVPIQGSVPVGGAGSQGGVGGIGNNGGTGGGSSQSPSINSSGMVSVVLGGGLTATSTSNITIPNQMMMISGLNDERIQEMIDVYSSRNLREEARRFSLLFHISKLCLSIKTCKEWYRRVQTHFLGALRRGAGANSSEDDGGLMSYVLSLDMDTLLKEALRPQLRVLKISLKKSLFNKVSKLVLEFIVRVYVESLLLFTFFYSVIQAEVQDSEEDSGDHPSLGSGLYYMVGVGETGGANTAGGGGVVDDMFNMNMIATKLLEDWDVIGHFFQDCMSEEATRECLIILADLHDILTSQRPTLYEKCHEFQEKYRIFDLTLFIKMILILRQEVKIVRSAGKVVVAAAAASSSCQYLDFESRIVMVPSATNGNLANTASSTLNELSGDEINQIMLDGIGEMSLVGGTNDLGNAHGDVGGGCGGGLLGTDLVTDLGDLDMVPPGTMVTWNRDNMYYWNKQMNVVRNVLSALNQGLGNTNNALLSAFSPPNCLNDLSSLKRITNLTPDEMSLIVGENQFASYETCGAGATCMHGSNGIGMAITDNNGLEGLNSQGSSIGFGLGPGSNLILGSSSSATLTSNPNNLSNVAGLASTNSSGGPNAGFLASSSSSSAAATATTTTTAGASTSAATGATTTSALSSSATSATAATAVAATTTTSASLNGSGNIPSLSSGGLSVGDGGVASTGMKRSFSLEFLSQVNGDDHLEKSMISSFLLGNNSVYSPIWALSISGLCGRVGCSIFQDFLEREERWWESIYNYYSQIYIPTCLFGMISTRLVMDIDSGMNVAPSFGANQEGSQKVVEDTAVDQAISMYQKYTHLSRILTNTFYGRYISDMGSYLQPATTEGVALTYLMGRYGSAPLLDLGDNLISSYLKPYQSVVQFKYYSNSGLNDSNKDWQSGYMIIEDLSIHIYDSIQKQRLLDTLTIRPNHDGERITSICIDPQDLSRTGFIIFWGERDSDYCLSSGVTSSSGGVNANTSVGAGGQTGSLGLPTNNFPRTNSNLSPALQSMVNSSSNGSSNSNSNLLQTGATTGTGTGQATSSMISIGNLSSSDLYNNAQQQSPSYNVNNYTDVKNCSLHVRAPTPQAATVWVSEIDMLIQKSRGNWGSGFLDSFERKRLCQYMRVE
ncbi:hypothetical protein OJ253_2476 [Cryptosporidium canis]|uniref:PH domain-containing protein n=1 Tax=Cryptosporidium canis TaxID=195482 RepID=A0A9D5DGE3_9CRYT|nr:hypothetical protein OJ253_2476 [Cryptosporidium canis]